VRQGQQLTEDLPIDLDADGELRISDAVPSMEPNLSDQTIDGWRSPAAKQKVQHRAGGRRIQELLIGILLLYGVGVVIAAVSASIAAQMPLVNQLLTGTVLPAIPFIIVMIAIIYALNYRRGQES